MSDDSQILVPRAFLDLYLVPGGHRLREPREVVAARHELCEDLAQLLTEQARTLQFELGVTEADVLQRVLQGLLADDAVVGADEAGWVVGRLAELLGWPWDPPQGGSR